MSNQEFENYVALIGKLLKLTREQRDQIWVELQDHLRMRVADLTSEGVSKPDAISQALEEFGDAAVMAKNFQTVINLKRRRWIMRFATFSIVGTFLAAVLSMALWPDNARFGTPNHSIARATATDVGSDSKTDVPVVLGLSEATKRNLVAEEALKRIISLNYDARPFIEIKEELEKLTGLNFLLSSSAQDDSLTSDEPIDFRMNDLPLNKALQLMLRTKNATYMIDEGVVVIISLDDAENDHWHRLKLFDCRELVLVLPKSYPMSFQSLGGGLGGGGVFRLAPFGDAGVTQKHPSEPIDAKSNSEKIKQLQSQIAEITDKLHKNKTNRKPGASSETTLVNLVQSMIRPDTWAKSGQGFGQVDVVNGVLVVKQTESILQQIENLIRDLEGNVLKKGTKVGKRRLGQMIQLSTLSNQVGSDNEDDPFGKKNEVDFDPFAGSEDDPFANDDDDPFEK